MRFPPLLKPGDKAVLLAPARKVTPEEMAPSIAAMRGWGLMVHEAAHLYSAHHQYSGTDAERLSDLQAALDDPEVRLILCGRGGYGTLRLLDHLDLRGIQRNPKWLVGFSDLTALHVALYQHGVGSLHGPMAISWNGKTANDEALAHLRTTLFEGPPAYAFPPAYPELSRTGAGTGRLIGGNLSMLSQLLGTATDFDTKGCILFLEDLDEYLYHIDRMFVHLQRGGKFENLAGLVIGGFTDMKDNPTAFGKSVEEIVAEKTAGFGYPVCFGFPTGHWPMNFPLVHGARVRLNVSHNQVELIHLPE